MKLEKKNSKSRNGITYQTLEQVNFVMKANQEIVIKTGIGNDACMMYAELNMVYCKQKNNKLSYLLQTASLIDAKTK